MKLQICLNFPILELKLVSIYVVFDTYSNLCMVCHAYFFQNLCIS